MGFAQGTILKKEATEFIDEVWAYLELQVEQAINGSIPGGGKVWCVLPSWCALPLTIHTFSCVD